MGLSKRKQLNSEKALKKKTTTNGSSKSEKEKPTSPPEVIYTRHYKRLGWVELIILFTLIGCVRLFSVLTAPIPDCDETFNYWEPTHLLIYKTGLQTWEYSPVFALRSYFYVWMHAAIGQLGAMVFAFSSKVQTFYFIRGALALACAACETYFINGIFTQFGMRIFFYTLTILVSSTGMFCSAQNFLPSTFSMCCLMVAYGSWYNEPPKVLGEKGQRRKWKICIFAAGCSVIVGWPFSVVCVFPLAMDTIYRSGFFNSLIEAIQASFLYISITIWFDWIYYKQIMFTPFNLVNYNKGSGSELYGTEPFSFYARNLLLNFNVYFVFAMIAPLLFALYSIMIPRRHRYHSFSQLMIYTVPFYIWFFFFSSLPHKEERFMVVVYPLLALSSALSLECYLQVVSRLFRLPAWLARAFNVTMKAKIPSKVVGNKRYIIVRKPHRGVSSWFFLFAFLIVGIVISVCRSMAIVHHYAAPLQVYDKLSEHIMSNTVHTHKTQYVCVGKEWYRFPSSFFLPHKTRLGFLRSSFRGLLPKYFEPWPESTSVIPTSMNDGNVEEMDRYVKDISQCDYIVDLDLRHQAEPYYKDTLRSSYDVLFSFPFLDAASTPQFSRILYIPGVTTPFHVYGSYYVLKKKSDQTE